jgi:Replication-relaxation
VELSARDVAVVRLVGWFGQLSSAHIAAAAFFESRSQTSCDRALARLTRSYCLQRIGRRAPGQKGGASPYVYQLGRQGWVLAQMAGNHRRRSVNAHTLEMADAYIALLQAERAGCFQMPQVELERPIGELRADLAVNLVLPDGRPVGFYLEVDRGFERPTVIEQKCRAYVRAWLASAAAFPFVVFVVQEEWRRREIERCIGKLDAEDRWLFSVTMLDELVHHVTGRA